MLVGVVRLCCVVVDGLPLAVPTLLSQVDLERGFMSAPNSSRVLESKPLPALVPEASEASGASHGMLGVPRKCTLRHVTLAP